MPTIASNQTFTYTHNNMKPALLIVDHGSKLKKANDMLTAVAELIRSSRPNLIVHIAHMELADPTIEDGINQCIIDGATHITVHPYMLAPGRHAIEDIPKMATEAAKQYPNVTVEVSEPLGIHQKIAEVILERTEL